MEYNISKRDYKIKVRIYTLFIVVLVIIFIQFFKIEYKFSLLIGIIGLLLTVATFIDPLISPILKLLFKGQMILKRNDIYHAVNVNILTADNIIRFKSPTTTWGLYSEGLKIFEDTLEAIKKVTSRGVKVRIIADIWDWERAKFAEALKNAGAEIKYNETVHDYYLIKDDFLLITMGTETRAHKVEMLDRNVRRMSETAIQTTKSISVEKAILIFDEEWDRISEDSVEKQLEYYLRTKCPHCNNESTVVFKNSKIELEK